MQSDPKSAQFQKERSFVVEILACSFDCGIDWMIDQMNANQALAKNLQNSRRRNGYDLWPLIAASFLRGKLATRTHIEELDVEQKNSILNYFFLMIYEQPLGRGSEPPSYRDWYVSRPEVDILVSCKWLDMGASGKALVALGTQSEKPDLIAVPVALSHGSCATIKR